MLDHWILDNAEYFKAWIIILLECNHKDNKVFIDGEVIECKRGQSVRSLPSWTKLFGKKWSVQKTRTFFNLLKTHFMIETKGLRKSTRLTVLKYDTYQSDATDRQQTDNRQITSNKNDKNERSKKITFPDKSVSYKKSSSLSTIVFNIYKKIGMPGDRINELYQTNTPEYLMRKRWLLDYYKSIGKEFKKPVGWLYNAVKNDYQEPEAFHDWMKQKRESVLNDDKASNELKTLVNV